MGEKKLNGIKKFAKSSAIFFIGNALSKLTVFLLLPLCTRTIDPQDYGYYDLSVTYIAIVIYILFFEIWTTIMRYMCEKEDEVYKQTTIKSGLMIFAFSSIAYFSIGAVLLCFFKIKAMELILLYGITHNIQQIYTYVARGYKEDILFAISGIVNAVVMVGLDLVLILAVGIGYKALYISYAAGNIVQALIIESKLHVIGNSIKVKSDNQLTKKMLIYSLPLAVNSVAYWLLTSYNRMVISNTLTLADNGLFAVGSKFGAMMNLITTCFNFALQDFSFSRSSDDSGNGKFFSNACQKYMELLLAGLIILVPCCKIAFSILVGIDYADVMTTIPLFLFVSALNAYSTFVGNIFCALKDTKSIFVSMLIACMCNLAMCNSLISRIGIAGANISMIISFIVDITIRTLLLRKRIGLQLNLTVPLIMIIVLAGNYLCYIFCPIVISAILLVAEGLVLAVFFREYIFSILPKCIRKTNKKVQN